MFLLQEYSTIITFREEWLDERLKYNDFNGETTVLLTFISRFSLLHELLNYYHTWTLICLWFNKLNLVRIIYRQTEVLDVDRSQQNLDAWFVLLQRERRPLPWNHCSQRLRPHLTERHRSLQYQVLSDALPILDCRLPTSYNRNCKQVRIPCLMNTPMTMIIQLFLSTQMISFQTIALFFPRSS